MTQPSPKMSMPWTLGRYRPIAELGRGGMATVYLAASQGPLNVTKLVVIKELKEDLSSDFEFTSMFATEARLAARLNHPNIVQTHDVVEHEGRHYIVMEYVEGQPFSAVRTKLLRVGLLTLDDQVAVLSAVLDALHYAHELRDYDGTLLQVVHRDVSPHNILVGYSGEVKLVDFGIAKVADSTTHTQTGVIKGKIAYMAPEQALGMPIDRRADVFTVGILLWEAIAGRRMWKGSVDVAIVHKLSIGQVPTLPTTGVSQHLVAACRRALAAKPADRYVNALEMKKDLDQYLATLEHRPQVRDFAQIVARAFGEERAKIAQVIDEQMRAMRASPLAAAPLPQINPSPSIPPPSQSSKAQVLEEGYSLRALALAAVVLVVVGALITTLVMAPWSH